MVWIWLSVVIITLIVELSTTQLVSIWFTLSGAISLGLSFIPSFPWWAQVLVFAVLSVTSFFTLRPLLMKWQKKQTRETSTNLDLIVGMYVRVLKRADFDNLGQAKIGDVVWGIKSNDGSTLEENEIVKIVAIEGNKLIAEKQTKIIEKVQMSSEQLKMTNEKLENQLIQQTKINEKQDTEIREMIKEKQQMKQKK